MPFESGANQVFAPDWFLPVKAGANNFADQCNWFSDFVVRGSGEVNQLFWGSVGLPAETLALDQIANFQTNEHQTIEQNSWTGAMYFILVFLALIPLDFLFCRPVTWLTLRLRGKGSTPTTKASWFLLHATFNLFVTIVSWKECWECFFAPLAKTFEPAGWWGSHPGSMLGVIAIGAFHIHHFVFFEFTFEDVIHHLGNAGVVVVIGVLCPWGRGTALSNMAMCAVPGGINYFAMWLRKGDLISVPNQKQLNRFCNIVIRYPIQLAAFYVLVVNIVDGRIPEVHIATFVFMWLGLIAHTANALYYCDQVVGNFWIFHSNQQPNDRRKVESASSNTASVGKKGDNKKRR